MSMHYRVSGDKTSPPMDAAGLMYAAEIAFAAGLFETTPADEAEALDAFDQAGFEIDEVEATP